MKSPLRSTLSSPPLVQRVPTQQEIALRAWDIWQVQGCPAGRDHENWVEAERQLFEEYRLRDEAALSVGSSADAARAPQESGDTEISRSDSPFEALKDRAPLATKVQAQVTGSPRPDSRTSPTSLEL
jgi:hypothetical protein